MALPDQTAVVRSTVRRLEARSEAWQITVLLVLILLPVSGSTSDRIRSQASPCRPFTCDGTGAKNGVAYQYQLLTHCGVLETRFDGRVFYVEALYPADIPAGLDAPFDAGTMALLSAHVALFRDAAGHAIRFVDSPPRVIGEAHPFTVHVLAGGNQLIDERFAARLWHPQGTLPSVSGPSSGNGQDAYTPVSGTLTLLSAARAVSSTPNTRTAAFVRTPSLCD